jgi:hypothetical protein
VEDYRAARETELRLTADLERVVRQRHSAAQLCAWILADVAAKRARASSCRVRVAIAEFNAFTAESARVLEQLDDAAKRRRELAQLYFCDAAGEP